MISQEQKGNLVQSIVTLLDETLIEESMESETELLVRSDPNSEARISINHLASTFWKDFISECSKHNINPKGEWIRVRSNFSTEFRRLRNKGSWVRKI